MGDGSVPTTAYDANGNIKRMQQWGLKITGSTQVDDLTYNFADKSNKLLNVGDAFNDAQTKLGDFRVSALNPVQSKTTTTVDYSYDVNGNMVKDLNKDIIAAAGANGIVYNYLNLPELITIKKDATTNKGTITYTYDAAGNKLKKVTLENPSTANGNKTITTTTSYVGGCVYESKDISPDDANNADYTDRLLFIGQEEGRIRFLPETNTLEYDYFLKDHVGNVRVVLTEEIQQTVYPRASMETAQSTLENTYYSNINTSRYQRSLVSDYPTTDNTTDPNDYIARTNGTDNKIGPAILLKVMSGDKFSVFVRSWYKKNGSTPDAPVDPLSALVAALASGVSGLSPAHGTSTQLISSGVLDPSATSFFNSRSSTGTDKPKAYLNWILLDEQLKFVADGTSGADPVGADLEFKAHSFADKAINKNGYLYIYVSNETPNINVFFDNLVVTHKRGPLLEENHYYPFGLTMAGISSKAIGKLDNKYKYNGIELNTEFDLNTYDAFYRNLDPQTGRWWQVDPKIESFEALSPYVAMMNNPIRYSDPLGDCPYCLLPEIIIGIGEIIEAAITTETVVAAGAAGAGTLAVANAGPIEQAIIESAQFNAQQIEKTGYTSVQIGFTSIPIHVSQPKTHADVKPQSSKPLVYIKPPDIVKPNQTSKGRTNATSGLPKSAKGKGSVPPDQRDPKRKWTKKERSEMLKKQEGKCAQCGADKTVDDVDAHHVDRHADGGKTDDKNGAAVCKDCHTEIH